MQSTAEFTGFETAHFDAFQERKWSSNRFNLERMRVREQAEALIARVRGGLGSAADGLEVSTTQDHPSVFNQRRVEAQWVLLTRPAGELSRILPLLSRERSLQDAFEDPQPQDQQIALAIRIGHDGVLVAVRLDAHAHLDRRNLVERLADPQARAELASLLSALPSEVTVSVGDQQVSAPEVTADQLEQWAQESAPRGWTIGREFSREHDSVGGSAFADEVASLAAQLLPIYRFAAWSPENDHVGGGEWLESEAARLAQAPEPAPAATPAPPKPTAERPTTRGGWSYRPDWALDQPRDLSRQAVPSTPSARARERRVEVAQERAAEAMATARNWSYSGPVREPLPAPEPPAAPPAPSERRTERDERRGGPGKGGPRGRGGDSPRDDGPRGRDDRRGGPRNDRRGGPRDDRKAGPRDDRKAGPRDDRRGGGRRDDRGRDDRRGGRRDQPRTTTVGGQKPVTQTQWVESSDAASLHDYVKVTGGLMSGKVGKVVELTSKGHYKVALGDGGMVFEVKKDQATKVTEA